jgi:hypothetical protein
MAYPTGEGDKSLALDGDRAIAGSAASASHMGHFETANKLLSTSRESGGVGPKWYVSVKGHRII